MEVAAEVEVVVAEEEAEAVVPIRAAPMASATSTPTRHPVTPGPRRARGRSTAGHPSSAPRGRRPGRDTNRTAAGCSRGSGRPARAGASLPDRGGSQPNRATDWVHQQGCRAQARPRALPRSRRRRPGRDSRRRQSSEHRSECPDSRTVAGVPRTGSDRSRSRPQDRLDVSSGEPPSRGADRTPVATPTPRPRRWRAAARESCRSCAASRRRTRSRGGRRRRAGRRRGHRSRRRSRLPKFPTFP